MDRLPAAHRPSAAPSRPGPADGSSQVLRSLAHGHHSGYLLLTTGWASDFELRVSQRVYHLHKFVLEQGSTYFNRIIRSSEEKPNTLMRHQMKQRTDLAHFERAIRLLYTKDFANELHNVEDAMGLLKVAYELSFEEAVEACIAYLKENVTLENLERVEGLAALDNAYNGLMLALTAPTSAAEAVVEKSEVLRKRVLRTMYLLKKDPHGSETRRLQDACEMEFKRNLARGLGDINNKVFLATFRPVYLVLARDGSERLLPVELHPSASWLCAQAKQHCDGSLLFRILSRFADHSSLSGFGPAADLSSATVPNVLSAQDVTSSSHLSALCGLVKHFFSLTPQMIKAGEIDVDRLIALLQWGRRVVLNEAEFDAFLVSAIRSMRVADHHYFFSMCLSAIDRVPEHTQRLITQLRIKYKTYSESDIFEFEY